MLMIGWFPSGRKFISPALSILTIQFGKEPNPKRSAEQWRWRKRAREIVSAGGAAAGAEINADIVVAGVDNVYRDAAVGQGLDHSGRGQCRQTPSRRQHHRISQPPEVPIPD